MAFSICGQRSSTSSIPNQQAGPLGGITSQHFTGAKTPIIFPSRRRSLEPALTAFGG